MANDNFYKKLKNYYSAVKCKPNSYEGCDECPISLIPDKDWCAVDSYNNDAYIDGCAIEVVISEVFSPSIKKKFIKDFYNKEKGRVRVECCDRNKLYEWLLKELKPGLEELIIE